MTLTSTPLELRKDATLSELKQLKQEWLEEARQQAIPAKTWEILRWLGRPVQFGMLREALFWQSGKISLIGSQRSVIYSPAHGTFVERRAIAVYVARENAMHPQHPNLQNPVDKAIFTGDQVLRWGWLVAESPAFGDLIEEGLGENGDNLLFVPGRWVEVILAATPQAEDAARQHGREGQEAERQSLIQQMLVGKAV